MNPRNAVLPLLSLALTPAPGAGPAAAGEGPSLSYFGRSSFKIRTASGFVVYVDPYAPGDYSEAADLVLVSHGHHDHNAVGMTTRRAGAPIVAPNGAVERLPVTVFAEGDARSFGPVEVRALPAANTNHPRGSGLGYLLRFDGLVLYYSGDTSRIPEMAQWQGYGIDWALLCCDGFYNMDPTEAARSAALMGAKTLVPVHTSKEGLFDGEVARSVKYARVAVLEPGAVLALRK